MPEKSRFVLRYRGQGNPSPECFDQVKSMSDVSVLESTHRMLSLEGNEARVRQLVSSSADWTVSREKSYVLPERNFQAKKLSP